MTDHIGRLHAASIVERPDGDGALVLLGEGGAVRVHVPEDMVGPLRGTVEELGLVYDDLDPTADADPGMLADADLRVDVGEDDS